jgi:hypothetical protein
MRQAGDSVPLAVVVPRAIAEFMRLRAAAFGAADTGSIPVGRIERTSRARASPPNSHVPTNEMMRCVWTNHPDGDRHCQARIPEAVAVGAWQRELSERRVPEGFFRFLWGGGEWLGYGLPNGVVRGVYCPCHCAARDRRTPRAQRLAEEREREECLTLLK